MRLPRSPLAAAALGAVSWTGLEYGLHRFLMHQLRGRGMASVEHLKHHADVTYYAPASKKLLSAAATSVVAYPVAAAVTDRRWAGWFTGGLIATYFGYEVAHRRTHTHPPVNAYGRWARRNHLHHHFGSPMTNHGVTTPVWDKVFGTYVEPGVVTVPRRMAPTWLLDETGEVRPEYAADYLAKGAARPADGERERDRTDAFANVAPTV